MEEHRQRFDKIIQEGPTINVNILTVTKAKTFSNEFGSNEGDIYFMPSLLQVVNWTFNQKIQTRLICWYGSSQDMYQWVCSH